MQQGASPSLGSADFTATNILIFIVFMLLLFGVLATCLGFQLYMRHSRKLPAVLVSVSEWPLTQCPQTLSATAA